jgi:biotin carboxylase
MVLGASPGQLPLIQKAVELGCYVITVDYLPENIGHSYAHHYVNCSTVDRTGVLAAAQALAIDGITTIASDVATATVAHVAERLGLPGCAPAVAATMSNKANFRAFQQCHGGGPGFIAGQELAAMADAVAQLTPPLMFKPVDTSGSRGITRVDTRDWAQWQQAFAYAQHYARVNTVCIEEFVEGIDVSGDGFLVNGHLRALITQKYKCGYIPTGHSFPTNLSAADQARVLAEVTRLCLALGYSDGPVDFDVKVAPERVVVIEMSPRLGGNGIPKLIRRATGADLIEATIHYALGCPVALPPMLTVTNPCGSWVFGSACAGRLVAVASDTAVWAQVPELFDYLFAYTCGDEVPAFEHSGNSLGYALFDCPAPAGYAGVVQRLRDAMQLQIVCHTARQETALKQRGNYP